MNFHPVQKGKTCFSVQEAEGFRKDFEILTRLKAHLFPYGTGQDDLVFLRENRRHGGKILL